MRDIEVTDADLQNVDGFGTEKTSNSGSQIEQATHNMDTKA